MGDVIPSLEEPLSTDTYLKYTTVTGFFLQDDLETDPMQFDFKRSNFGLIDQLYDTDSSLPESDASATPWQRFTHKLSSMNQAAPEETSYKLIFLGRHGQGYHNVAEEFYSTKAWDCHYSRLNGNASSTWFDAHLTPLGVSQALSAHDFWASQFSTQHTPAPQIFFSSPLDRSINTATLTFATLPVPAFANPAKCIIKENLREGIGIHTCDRRSTLSEMRKRWPAPPEGNWVVEPDFSEKDMLWVPDLRETASAQTARLTLLLDDVFSHEAASKSTQVISMTSHSGTISSTLRAIGHREFLMQTGGVIPVLVRIDRLQGTRPEAKVEPWQPLGGDCAHWREEVGERLVRDYEALM